MNFLPKHPKVVSLYRSYFGPVIKAYRFIPER
jgi:hypothetical protein